MVFHDGSCYVSRAVATEVTKGDTVQQNTGGICKSHPIICPSIHPSVHPRGLDEPRRGLGRGGDGQMDRWMGHTYSPCILQDFVPFGSLRGRCSKSWKHTFKQSRTFRESWSFFIALCYCPRDSLRYCCAWSNRTQTSMVRGSNLTLPPTSLVQSLYCRGRKRLWCCSTFYAKAFYII